MGCVEWVWVVMKRTPISTALDLHLAWPNESIMVASLIPLSGHKITLIYILHLVENFKVMFKINIHDIILP